MTGFLLLLAFVLWLFGLALALDTGGSGHFD